MKYDLNELIQTEANFKKFQTQYYKSIKYHATTHRLKLSLDYLDCSQAREKIKDIFIYKTCLEMAIITYAACFNNSKALLKIPNDKLNKILNGNEAFQKTHEKVIHYRDKVIAHQDKVNELEYSIDILKNGDKISFEFPFLLKFEFNNDDQINFRNLIITVHNYLDLERQEHDKNFTEDLSKVL